MKADGTATWWHEDDKTKLQALSDYCEKDVLAEEWLDNALPDIPASEQKLWQLNCIMNARGIGVDTKLVDNMLAAADDAKCYLNDKMKTLTNGAVDATTKTARLTKWFQDNGLPKLDSCDHDPGSRCR
jgi:DNA polymerase